MKKFKLLFVILFLMLYNFSFSQLEKGNLQIGGNVGFDIQLVEDDDNVFTLMFNPGIASFVADNVAIGGNLGITYTKSGDFSSTVTSILPLVRYYIPGNNENTAFFLNGSAGLTIISFDFGGGSESESAFTFAVGPGIAFFLSDHVSIDTGVTYSRIGGDFDVSNIALNIGLQVWMPQKNKD